MTVFEAKFKTSRQVLVPWKRLKRLADNGAVVREYFSRCRKIIMREGRTATPAKRINAFVMINEDGYDGRETRL